MREKTKRKIIPMSMPISAPAPGLLAAPPIMMPAPPATMKTTVGMMK
jgi:hypothetical protein